MGMGGLGEWEWGAGRMGMGGLGEWEWGGWVNGNGAGDRNG